MKVCEVYTSVQGEGPNVGKPITFIRFGGCNLRCPGWGEGTLPDGSVVPGCDTVFAVYPEWRGTWNRKQGWEIMRMIPAEPRRVCLTGGEPLIQQAMALENLFDLLAEEDYQIDLFTNGTKPLPEWAMSPRVTVVMDFKLPGSGEYGKFDQTNWAKLQAKDAIKFVCADTIDFEVALGTLEDNKGTLRAQVFFGPVWGVLDEGELAEWMTGLYPEGRLNMQTHKFLWDPDERRR